MPTASRHRRASANGAGPKLTPRERFEVRVGRIMASLPPKAQLRLSGKPPVRMDGLTLEPDIQLLLAMMERQGNPPIETLPPPQARAAVLHQSKAFAGPEIRVKEVRDLQVDGAEGPIKARHYVPPEDGGPHPLIVYFHGGGFVICDLDTHDAPCRLLCLYGGAHVLSIDYRLAPEHPFPAAVDDCQAALRWAFEHVQDLGADPDRIGVAGDSAGGNLATGMCLLARKGENPMPHYQHLIYPVTDFANPHPSRHMFAEGFFLTQSEMDWFHEHYALSCGADSSDPRLSPLLVDDLSGLPPAYICTAGFDPLRDEGEAYAQRLREAGNKVVQRRFPGLIHGFANMTAASRSSRDAMVEMAGAARAMLGAL
ncbi:MAG TPA: alpha/beta hydrolase [Thermoleophilaceae bacterium]